ncbi:hypothetical protein ACFL7M_14145 [Thermodesulfobacteriota bacterium]
MQLIKKVVGQIEKGLQRMEIRNYLKSSEFEDNNTGKEIDVHQRKREIMRQFIEANKIKY